MTESIKVFEVYDSIINSIDIHYQDIYLPTRLGETHIIKTGSDLNPPLILIHAYYASAASWYKNIKQLSENYKVYNIDIIGDPNKSKLQKPDSLTTFGRSDWNYHKWFNNK